MKDGEDGNLDRILIRDLLLRCIIGINESERKEKQDVLINIVLWTDFSEATKLDDVQKTVDYKEVTKEIIRLVENSEFFLIETLAERIAEICLKYKKVQKVKVIAEKPGALRFARSVGAEIVRKRN